MTNVSVKDKRGETITTLGELEVGDYFIFPNQSDDSIHIALSRVVVSETLKGRPFVDLNGGTVYHTFQDSTKVVKVDRVTITMK